MKLLFLLSMGHWTSWANPGYYYDSYGGMNRPYPSPPVPSPTPPGLSSQADASLASSMTDLIHNILNTLDATPPPGKTFSAQDVKNIQQVRSTPYDPAWNEMASSVSRQSGYPSTVPYVPTNKMNNGSSYGSSNKGTQTNNAYPSDQPLYNPYPDRPPGYWDPPPPPNHGTTNNNDALKIGLGVGLGVPFGMTFFALIIYLIWRQYNKKKKAVHPVFPLPTNKNDYVKHYDHSAQGSPILTSDDPWELDRTKLSINYDKKLGSGAFCNVFKASIKGDAPVAKVFPGTRTEELRNCDVAVKMLPSFADDIARSDFMQEINFMKSLAYHPHLVSMLGYVADRKNPMLLVEYCEKGDLLHFIRERKAEIQQGMSTEGLKIKDLLSFSWQISNGCEYLNSVGCIHRDIAARNVLVDSQNQCKIGDFGLCRLTDSLLYTARGGRLPLKWMAPESLSSYEYSFKSDVWSYGVLLWELFSLGEVPYGGIQTTDLLEYLERGNRLEQPNLCPDEIYSVMKDSWTHEATNRPTFHRICARLAVMLEMATESYGYLIPNRRSTDSA